MWAVLLPLLIQYAEPVAAEALSRLLAWMQQTGATEPPAEWMPTVRQGDAEARAAYARAFPGQPFPMPPLP